MRAAVRGLANLVRRIGRGTTASAVRRPGPARALALGLAGTALLASLLCNLLYGPLLRQNWIRVPGLPQRVERAVLAQQVSAAACARSAD